MKVRSSCICLFTVGLSALSVVYAVDEDGDQISDVYAQHYGLAAGSGEEDPDSDDHNNYIESIWGTDPFDNSSVFRASSVQVANSVFDFAIPTVVGKRYQFQGQSDLNNTGWINIDEPFTGKFEPTTGKGKVEHLLTGLPISGTDKYFWRVQAVSPLDRDDDGLDSFEELLLGTSDTEADSDGDKISDLNEFLSGLNPVINLDADADGLPDDWESFHGVYSSASDSDGDGWTNLEEFMQNDDPNELNSEIAPPTLELMGNYTTSSNLYTITDGGDLRICVRTTAASGTSYYLVESPNLEPYLRFNGSSTSPSSLSAELNASDPEAKQAPILKVNNGEYTIRAKSYLNDNGNMLESDEVEWTIRVRPYGSSSLPSGVKYVSFRAYYDPVTKLFHTTSFDVPQTRRRSTSRGWLINPTSGAQPDYQDFIPDLSANPSNVWMAYDGDGSYSTDFNSAYWGTATMVNLGTGWAAGDEFFIDFGSSTNRKRYYGDSKRGSISTKSSDVVDIWEENLGYGWMTADGFVPDKTYTISKDDIYYDDERGRLTTSRPQGIDNDEDLGEGWIGGWMSRFISEETSIDSDRDRVPDALERELGLSVNSPTGGEDSDGDGLMDYEEVQQGSDPSNANDTFASTGSFHATKNTLVPVRFTVGDHSGSHSEQWELKIYNVLPSGEVLNSRVQAGLGVLASREFSFPEGFNQRVELNHVQGQGDFDYTFEIVMGSAAPDGTALVIDDPSGLLGVNDNVQSGVFSGDVAITVPKVRLKTQQDENAVIYLGSSARTPIYFEAAPLVGPGTFKLSQNNDKITIWDIEVDGTELTEPSSKIKSWSLDSSQLSALNATNRIWIEGLELSEELNDTMITLQYYDEDGAAVGRAAELAHTLLKVEFGYPNTANKEINTKDLDTNEYGDFEKCVARVWDSSEEVDLTHYLADWNMSVATSNLLEWKINGTLQQSSTLDVGEEPDTNEMSSFEIEVKLQGGSEVLDRLILVVVPEDTEQKFLAWFLIEYADKGWHNQLPGLYSSFVLPDEDPEPSGCDPQRWKDPEGFSFGTGSYHPGAFKQMRSELTSGEHGHQATYDGSGNLILDGVAAGTADRFESATSEHKNGDAIPFIWAAQLDGNPVQEGSGLNFGLSSDLLYESGEHINDYLRVRPIDTGAYPHGPPNLCVQGE